MATEASGVGEWPSKTML
uniref:Uncharacterized protein n=2 Tax=Musa acuminata subsp. malaccensis TaxID=214687 RepID=A0A804K609_MUSAM